LNFWPNPKLQTPSFLVLFRIIAFFCHFIGCGDTYTAIYCYARLKKYSIYHSGLLASAGSGMKTEKTGPLYSSFGMIKKRVESICKI